MKYLVLFVILTMFLLTFPSTAQELDLMENQLYVFDLDEEIKNIHTDKNILDAQILTTIFDTNRQILLTLKKPEGTILQVQTTKQLYNYKVICAKNNKQPNENLVMIDLPYSDDVRFNFDVDVYEGK